MTRASRKEVVASEATDLPKEPSFEGRLQLKNFMFSAPDTSAMSSGPRRSSRLSAATLTATSTPSASSSPAAGPSPTSNTGFDAAAAKSIPTPSPSPRKKRPRPSSTYAPPSTYAHLPLLPDALAPNLLILFIGLNPGLQTARVGHAYAHPSNHFWRLLHRSGLTPVRCAAAEDRTLPARFALGHTNIVARPSRHAAELRAAELDAGVGALEAKCARFRPEAVAVVGKGIWESLVRVWRGRRLARGEFAYGWQAERMGAGDGWEGARVFVATSTSGLAASVRPEEKARIWKELGDWCVQRRKERGEEAAKEDGIGEMREEGEEETSAIKCL
ncbi:DNA glycosylase [Xylariomycetidae sp. FL0641]|nr:DNA glycosylase [Xylariomycetidae sp. FL0641]